MHTLMCELHETFHYVILFPSINDIFSGIFVSLFKVQSTQLGSSQLESDHSYNHIFTGLFTRGVNSTTMKSSFLQYTASNNGKAKQ